MDLMTNIPGLLQKRKEAFSYQVTIKGNSPYLQHRMLDDVLEEREINGRGSIIENRGANKEADLKAFEHSYHDELGFYFPTFQIKGAMVNAGKLSKAKMGHSSRNMSSVVAADFKIREPKIRLPQYDSIFVISAVNQITKGRIMTYRPQWTSWELTFTLDVENENINHNLVYEILVNAGWKIGVGSYRPQHLGVFGTFEVTQFTLLNGKKTMLPEEQVKRGRKAKVREPQTV